MDYQKMLASADEEARDEYDFDPRVAFHETTKTTHEILPHDNLISVAVGDVQTSITELSHPQFQNTLSLPVQQPPVMVEKKRVVIIDSSQRDWTIQPDAYSNIFSFGTQLPQTVASPQVPFYFNNPTIPLSAWETPIAPPTVGSGPVHDIPSIPNNQGQTFPEGVQLPGYVSTTAQGLVKPTYGWKLVFSNGVLVHSPTPINYKDPNTKVYFYPVYSAAEPTGAQIGVDVQPKRYGANSYSYTTQLALSNVTEIKLMRSILPVRGTQSYTSSTFSGNIDYPLAFHSQPYLLMTIQNLKGNYLGGSQLVQNAFTVLTQNSRNLYEGVARYPAQFSDYYPWGDEAYKFDPPLSKLSNANIQMFNPAGNVFSQLDNLNIIDVVLDTVNVGKVKFFVSQNTSNNIRFGDCNAFLTTDIRVGDEIAFYSPALSLLCADVSCSGPVKSFFNLMSNNFLITDICGTDFKPTYVFPSSSIGTSFTAVPKLAAGYSGMSNAVVTICSMIQTLSQVCLQQYLSPPSGLSFAGKRSFSQDYAIPIMNLNAQATFVLEVTTMEPDTTNIQKIIPN